MPDGSQASNDDLMAKMREALERKQSNDRGVEHAKHERGHAEAHGPAVSRREFRRKSS